MIWEEYKFITETLLNFYSLDKQKQEMVLLMIDGLKARQNEKT